MAPDRSVTHVSGTICYPCLRSGECPTRGVGRTRTMFHNTLVVGSSPTSSSRSLAQLENFGARCMCPTATTDAEMHRALSDHGDCRLEAQRPVGRRDDTALLR